MSEIPIITDKNGRDVKGRFLNGNTGKPKGAINKNTKDLREFIVNFLNEKSVEIPDIWDSLDTKDKATLYLHLLKQVMPKQSDSDKDDITENRIEVEILEAETERIELLNELLNKLR